MSRALYLALILISAPFSYSYNLDTSFPIIHTEPEFEESNYFGYTVALRSETSSHPFSLFVGSPGTSNGEGKVYRCTDIESGNQTRSSTCQGLDIDRTSSPRELLSNDKLITITTGKSGGLGMSMAMDATSSKFTVCAPRSVVYLKYPIKWLELEPKRHTEDMNGYCYIVDANDKLRRDNLFLIIRDSVDFANQINNYINRMYGFSINYPIKKSLVSNERILGMPMMNGVIMKHTSKLRPRETEHRSFLGYSVSSGYYFEREQLAFAAGGPGWLHKGKVILYNFPPTGKEERIELIGSELGEYFGASLATGDFDGDGFDDLAVGAPHWGEVNFGRVYTFYGNGDTDKELKPGKMLQGAVENGQFGYTLASVNLDNDSYSDLVVSAPWEESGVVYIYYGHANFRMKDSSTQIIQQIKPSQFKHFVKRPVERFGFSLSNSVDIDGNGYRDLAIGAHKSGHAIILRSRPVIEVVVKLDSNPMVLTTSTTSFNLSVCAEYDRLKAPRTLELGFKMTVDANHKRVKSDGWEHFTRQFTLSSSNCGEPILLSLKADARNIIDPILINVKLDGIKEKGGEEFCPDCPVLSRKSVQESILTVPFNTGCREGAICNANLSMTASLVGTRQNNEWIVGSGDISLKLIMRNDGEPAYQTEVIVDMPPHVRLRNAIPSCKEHLEGNAVSLVCDFGNPLKLGEQKRLNIALNMENVVQSPESTKLTFNITRRSRSVDHGNDKETILGLTVENMINLTLSGMTDKESHDYARTEDKSKVLIRHTYQTVKIGSTPITKARLTINVPTSKIGTNDSFLNIINPTLTDSSGKTHSCSIHDPNFVTEQFDWSEESDTDMQRQIERREINDNDNETEVTTEPSTTVGEPKIYDINTSTPPTTKWVKTPDRIVYLNCSTDGISCAKITCPFSLLKTSDDVGSIALEMVFDADAFYSSEKDFLTIKFNTNASVEILLPHISDPTSMRNTSTTVSTMLFNIPEAQKLAGWIIPASVFVGILLFCVITIILFKVGFFNKVKKWDLTNAKKKEEMILNAKENDEQLYDTNLFVVDG